jgi:hypothetical protein
VLFLVVLVMYSIAIFTKESDAYVYKNTLYTIFPRNKYNLSSIDSITIREGGNIVILQIKAYPKSAPFWGCILSVLAIGIIRNDRFALKLTEFQLNDLKQSFGNKLLNN